MDSRLELSIRRAALRALLRTKIRVAIGICFTLALAIYTTFGCQLGSNACLRMSDCDKGFTCSEGVCLSPFANDAVLGAAADTEAGATDATVKADASTGARASTRDAASDTTDGGSTDAAPDA